ncbi:MAG: hypothetical protein ACI8PZ_007464 [Myxococcota bacterium]|jgi:hypothetical protein
MEPIHVPAERSPGLAAAPVPTDDATAGQLESYVRAGMHTDREPGTVVAICHPLRMYKVPEGLLDGLRAAGFDVRVVETQAARAASISGIRDALVAAAAEERPLDVVVFSGDGSLDHHVLVAAYQAFFPELVLDRPGEIRLDTPSTDAVGRLSSEYRAAFLPPPSVEGIAPDDQTIRRIWALRMHIRRPLTRGASLHRVARAAGASPGDRLLRIAAFASLFPEHAVLRPDGYDLGPLAEASRDDTYRGLYPFIRSIAVYPCGTAADNALYAGVPGWAFAQAAKWLHRFPALHSLRDRWGASARQQFIDYFTRDGVVVPARLSVVGMDGDWQLLCSHAASGPAGGRFFEGDLEKKSGGLLSYLAKIPSVLLDEGLFNRTLVRVRAFSASRSKRLDTLGRLVEGLYTNRAFIAGVGSIPSANPTGFVGQSSLVVGPPLMYRDLQGSLRLDRRGLFAFTEAIIKGLLGRGMHMVGLGVGRLAGGGRFASLSPDQQITLREGESVRLDFADLDRRPKSVSTQVSGDPFQAHRMDIRVAWGPLPLLAAPDSLLIAAAQRSLSRLRAEQTWHLDTHFIGGLAYYRHRSGPEWSLELATRTGLVQPPRTLPGRLDRAQSRMMDRFRLAGVAGFVDTTEQGFALGRRGRHAHDTEQRAHVVVLRTRSRTLLVRQIRQVDGQVFEARTHYRYWWGSWVITDNHVREWSAEGEARVIQEERWFRSAEAFQAEAPAFFPFDDP